MCPPRLSAALLEREYDRMIVAFTMVLNVTKPDGEPTPEMYILRDLFLLDSFMLAKRAPQPQMDFPVFEVNTHCGGGVHSGTRRIPIPKPPERISSLRLCSLMTARSGEMIKL